ncbi:DUF4136 domain-containing protein [Algoriphagus confluentis]|uniref:DUF4136 domain-containing protein n=1 Tax=Algoriphagus confluentis TaxID=1697556 RepID=A0ABQ6PT17_9BACT|nr:hypothetical protein Aconfl_37340 [Algoriphagus confluentis]
MKKFILSFLIGLSLLTCLLSCSSLTTNSYKAKGVDLDQYQTYAWVNLKHFVGEDQENKQRYARFILEHADEEIRAKGFQLDTINPQVVFQFDTKIEHKISYNRTPSVSMGIGIGGPGYYVGGAVPVSGGQVVTKEFDEGMLTIEMIETQTGRLLWRGWAQEKVGFETNLEADLEKAIPQIFMRLPIKKKK